MFVDEKGCTWYKIGLHMHTNLSDGHVPPEKALKCYRDAGYDGVAITDHWLVGAAGEFEGMQVYSGCEYNIGGGDSRNGVYHILGLFMERDPALKTTATAQQIVDAIHSANGFAVLAHPAWSLETPAQILPLSGVDATEIYNTISGMHSSRRADSSAIVDMLASLGRIYPLLATDDAHYYDGDECRSFVMVQSRSAAAGDVAQALRDGNFYATQGPALSLRQEGLSIVADFTPAVDVAFFSNLVWHPDAGKTGEGITHAKFCLRGEESFVRLRVTDENGRSAWSNILIPKHD